MSTEIKNTEKKDKNGQNQINEPQNKISDQEIMATYCQNLEKILN